MQETKPKKWATAKRVLRPVLLVAFLAIFVVYFMGHRSDFASIRNLSILSILVIASLQILIILTNTWLLMALCMPFNIKVGGFNSFIVNLKASMINFFGFLQGGVGYKAIYLKKNHELNYKKFASLLAANYVIVFAVSSTMAVIGLLIRRSQNLFVGPLVFLTFAGIAVVMFGIMLFNKRFHLKRPKKIAHHVNEILDGWHTIARNHKLVAILFGLAIVQAVAMSTMFYTELAALGYHPNAAGVLVYAGIANLSILIAFTPGAVGFRESLLLIAQQSLGVSTSAILVSSTVDRTIYFVLMVLAAIIVQKPVLKLITRGNPPPGLTD